MTLEKVDGINGPPYVRHAINRVVYLLMITSRLLLLIRGFCVDLYGKFRDLNRSSPKSRLSVVKRKLQIGCQKNCIQ